MGLSNVKLHCVFLATWTCPLSCTVNGTQHCGNWIRFRPQLIRWEGNYADIQRLEDLVLHNGQQRRCLPMPPLDNGDRRSIQNVVQFGRDRDQNLLSWNSGDL